MTTPIVFTFPETAQHVRSVMVDGEPWFVGKDACDGVGIVKYRDALVQLDEDERVSMAVDTPGGAQQMVLVSEAGVYALLLISRSPKVKPFRRWLTHEVLPALRRTGSYSVEVAPAFPVPRTLPEALRAFANEVEAHDETKQRVAELEPAAAAWDKLAAADQDFSVREAAHILNRDPHIETGERRLFAVLRGMGLVDKTDRPYQKHTAHVRLRPRSYTNPVTDEETPAKPQVRVTLQGIAYLHKRLGGAVNVHRLVAEEQLALPASTGAEITR